MAYTYLITCLSTGQKYYGSRYAKNCCLEDLGKTYFSSSKEVHKLIKEYGLTNFTFEVRRTFQTREEAIEWEFKVLRRLRADNSPMWINKHNGDGRVNGGFYGRTHAPETIEKMRKVAKGRTRPNLAELNRSRTGVKMSPRTEEHKKKIGDALRGRLRPDLAERNRRRKGHS